MECKPWQQRSGRCSVEWEWSLLWPLQNKITNIEKPPKSFTEFVQTILGKKYVPQMTKFPQQQKWGVRHNCVLSFPLLTKNVVLATAWVGAFAARAYTHPANCTEQWNPFTEKLSVLAARSLQPLERHFYSSPHAWRYLKAGKTGWIRKARRVEKRGEWQSSDKDEGRGV